MKDFFNIIPLRVSSGAEESERLQQTIKLMNFVRRCQDARKKWKNAERVSAQKCETLRRGISNCKVILRTSLGCKR